MVNYDGFIWLIWFYYVIMVNSNNWLNTLWFYVISWLMVTYNNWLNTGDTMVIIMVIQNSSNNAGDLDVLFPLVGWLIEGFEETLLTTGK